MTPRDVVRELLRHDLGAEVYPRRGALPYVEFAVIAKSSGILAGMEFVPLVLDVLERKFFPPSAFPDKLVRLYGCVENGTTVGGGERVATLYGDAEVLLKAERTVLNILSRSSGIATNTAKAVARVAHTGVKLLDTRKSPSILRAFDKEAFKVGGGHPHRSGLYDAPMVKDNDIALYGLKGAIDRRMRELRFQSKLEVEVDSFALLQEVLADGRADIIMLDNMSPAEMRQAVHQIRFEPKRYVIEASGIGSHDLVAVAETGVDAISLSSLVTEGAGHPLDLSMKVVQ